MQADLRRALGAQMITFLHCLETVTTRPLRPAVLSNSVECSNSLSVSEEEATLGLSLGAPALESQTCWKEPHSQEHNQNSVVVSI